MPDITPSVDALLAEHGTHPENGLTQRQAQELLEKHGENKLQEQKPRSFLQKFLQQLKDYMVVILLIAAAISFVVALLDGSGEYIDSIIILAIVILNAYLGVRQENKAENALSALQNLSAPTAKALRDGVVANIPSAQIVPGDIVLLEAGDFIPADGRLLESASLQCEESALTGESLPVEKDTHVQVSADAPLGDRLNQVYTGCSVTYGRGRALVTATGMDTEIGKIAGLLESAGPESTPLQQRLAQLGKYLGILAVAICALIFFIGMYRMMNPMEMFMTSVSLAVAVIPEGLTAVVTVVLALGVQRMVERGAIIRRLPAVETLGSASVICSDKTGTLTQNRMTVRQVWAVGEAVANADEPLPDKALQVIRLGTLCNDGRIETQDGEQKHIGDPTETAIVAAALKNQLTKADLDLEYPRVGEIPFDSDRKCMTTIHQVNGEILAVVKGGYDVILDRCSGGAPAQAEAINLEMAGNALRVLAVACKSLNAVPERPESAEIEAGLTFIGLIGMIDPPREESREAVSLCGKAGIRTVMITGDHVVTASAIAKDLGILTEGADAITGAQLAALSDEELAENIDRYRVYARVSPEDKIRIVKAWQRSGEVVAMTGDGVNDAPALKAADIGCAMGITGTDVAKSAADMVLTDDNFSTIVEAVRGGRGIYDNIRKTIQFLLGSNLGEVFVVLVAMLMGWGSPLLAIHLLLINVVTDAFPALALGVEPVSPDVMSRKPVPKSAGIFSGGLGVVIVLQGVMVGALTLVGYYIGNFVDLSAFYPHSHEIGMTMAFLVLSLSQLAQAMNCRSSRSLFRVGFGSNRQMLWAVLVSALVVTLICLIPPLEAVFHLTDLSMAHWLIVLGLSIAPLVIVELVKLFAGLGKRA